MKKKRYFIDCYYRGEKVCTLTKRYAYKKNAQKAIERAKETFIGYIFIICED
jgi:hypothetical protein